MKKHIEFESSSAPKIPTMQNRQQQPQWQDISVKPEYRKMGIRFPEGRTLVRLLPHIKGGTGTSYVELIDVIKTPGFTAPTTAGDLFQRAYQWLYQNRPETLQRYEKNEKGEKVRVDGFTLRPSTQAIAWAVYWAQDDKGNPGMPVKLGLMRSAFSSGKNPGLLADIVASAEATEVEPGTDVASRVYANSIADANAGRNLTITKTVDPKLPRQQGTTYTFAISSKEAGPITSILDQVSDEEMNLLIPLSSVVNVLTEAEQRALLVSYLGSQIVAEMGL